MTSQHTPGPWRSDSYDEDPCHANVNGENWGSFAQVVVRMETEDNDSDVGLANLRLILAAPKLYDALNQAALELEEASKLIRAAGFTGSSTIFMTAVGRIENLLSSIDGESP